MVNTVSNDTVIYQRESMSGQQKEIFIKTGNVILVIAMSQEIFGSGRSNCFISHH